LKVISLLSSRELVLLHHKETYFVVITLRGHEVKNLVACLVEKSRYRFSDPPKVFPGRVLKPTAETVDGALHWVVSFFGLPQEDSKDYWLFVAETGAKSDKGGNFTAAIEVTVKALRSEDKPKRDDEIVIQFPQNNSTLPPSFNAFGTGSATDAVASMMRNDQVVSTGDKILDSDGVWMFQFADVPENTGYLLRVGPPIEKKKEDEKKDRTDTKQGLTVDGVQGEPIEAQPPPPPANP
jgi:hypothetical protein